MLLKRSIRFLKNSFFYRTLPFRSPTSIAIDKLLVGNMHGFPSQEWFQRTDDRTRLSMRLLDSPYVSFLREVDANPQILSEDEMLRETSYFRMADLCRQHMGWYFAATTPHQICQWMRQYYRLYKTDRGLSLAEPVEGRGHSKDGSLPIVNRIADSDLYEVEDGHHRLAIMLAKGHQHAQVIVRGRKRTFLQKELLRVNQTHGKELYQPVPLPEVQTWSLIRKCEDRFALIYRFIEQQQLNQGLTVVDCACSYGWFVKRFKDRGFRVLGLDKDATAINLGRLIYDLEESDFMNVRLEDFLFTNKNTFDIVLCLSVLHHYALGKETASPEEIVEGLSRITKSFLFLDTGQAYEQWFCKKLPEWNTDFIRDFLLKHGIFKEVIPLGSDTDNVGRYSDNYGRILFACKK